MRIAVGSANPVKLDAARRAVSDAFGDGCLVSPVTVSSGIADQPMGSEEILTGAVNRARAARSTLNADYGIGLEGGVVRALDRWYCIGWSVIADSRDEYWAAPSNGVFVPEAVMDVVLQNGLTLGDAADRVFGRVNSKQNGGLIGIVTGERIDRLVTFRVPLFTAICSMRLDRGRVDA